MDDAPILSHRANRADGIFGNDKGALQDVYGQAKETATNAAEAIREGASEADDFLRATIEQRPYTAAAVALAIGYLIGRFGRRANY